jgi:ADP-heptose:LPS heptosyltransferase
MKLRKWLRGKKDEELFFEQLRKQWMIGPFLGRTYPYIHRKNRNIYDSYLNHFGVAPELLVFQTPPTTDIHKILVLPESRKKSKSFQPAFIHQLASSLTEHGFDVTTAFYKTIPFVPEGKVTSHDAFADLIGLIQAADLVITADSLPAHLSQLLHRPHFICYDGKPNPEWVTPYARNKRAIGLMGDAAHVIHFINPAAKNIA